MTPTLPPMRLTGAKVLRDGQLRTGDLSMCDGRLCDGVSDAVDMSGYLLLPGIVDLHGDAFERHMAPRPAARFPVAAGLASVERELAAHGVTTAWLAQSWSWEGGMRGPEFAETLLAALAEHEPRAIADLRVQIRCETHMPETRQRLIDAVRRFGVDYVVFNDHLPEALQMVTVAPHKLAHWAESGGDRLEDFVARVRSAKDRGAEVPRHLNALASAFDEIGVTYGSHDDPDGETRDMYHAIGARICEFPTRISAAVVARAYGDPVIMGAPNVVRGGSQSGNISAKSLIARDLCDVLVSDYHYPALPAAVWTLSDSGLKPFAKAWEMVSTNPARVMNLSDRGTLSVGKRADFVVMNEATRSIEATISKGRVSYLAGAAAARLLSIRSRARLEAE